ncbi:MAG: aspartate carbamoyltransferase regulatory subunit [Catonella sp.]|jgi:aspartate carbamoyltransferase regulatory subunit|nr:aspartate carbamoyltransferase regulatory subunit [Catonella sp.]MDY6356144.1 aspartate carbamoyltransferase regulatory subunit [Catonella sp.]
MLNISGLDSGYVIDHIPAGLAIKIYGYLGLDHYANSVAIIQNAKSSKMGKKDIIKIEGLSDKINLDILSMFGDNITINIIKNGAIIDKKRPDLPELVSDVFKCKNPRCITTEERGLHHVFKLTDRANKTYRCVYCETALTSLPRP